MIHKRLFCRVIYMCNDYLYQYLSGDSEVLEYCHNKLKVLIDSDQGTGTEYLKTLKVYLETGKSYIASAEILFVHRNTVLQRIKKITELLEIDLRDFDVTNEYYLMLKILEYEKERT